MSTLLSVVCEVYKPNTKILHISPSGLLIREDVIFYFDFTYIPEHVSTKKAGRPLPLHEQRRG